LKAEINEEAWASLHSDLSRPFDKPKSGRIAVKVINHLGDEVMKSSASDVGQALGCAGLLVPSFPNRKGGRIRYSKGVSYDPEG
jgi:hypothetical protein